MRVACSSQSEGGTGAFDRPEVLVTSSGLTQLADALSELQDAFSIRLSPRELPADMSKTEIIILGNEYLGTADLDRAPNLKLICRFGVHTNRVEHAALAKRGITLTNCPAASSGSVADLAFAGLLSLVRRLDIVINPDRVPGALLTEDMDSLRFGIIGFGSLGQALCARAQGFGMPVQVWNRTPRTLPEGVISAPNLHSLVAQSDVLAVAVKGNPQTVNILDEALLAQATRPLWLVNVAYLEAIDPHLVTVGLRNRTINGYVVDFVDPGFVEFGSHRVVMTPHVGAKTKSAVRKKASQVISDIFAWRTGQRPVNQIEIAQP